MSRWLTILLYLACALVRQLPAGASQGIQPTVHFNISVAATCQSSTNVVIGLDNTAFVSVSCLNVFAYVFAMDGATGELRWNFSLPQGVGSGYFALTNYNIVLVDGGYALNAKTGDIVWTSGSLCAPNDTHVVQLDVSQAPNQLVYVECITTQGYEAPQFLMALHALTGALQWQLPNVSTAVDPFIQQGKLIVMNQLQSNMLCLDAGTGALLWNVSGMPDPDVSFPCGPDLFCAISEARFRFDDSNAMYGYSLSNGSNVWRNFVFEQSWFRDSYSATNMFVAELRSVTAYSLSTGEQVWGTTLPPNWGNPSFVTRVGGAVLAGSDPPTTIAVLDAALGNITHTFCPNHDSWFGTPIAGSSDTSFVVQEFVLTGGSTVYCVDAVSNSALWSFGIDSANGRVGFFYDEGLTFNGKLLVAAYQSMVVGFLLQ